MAKLSLTKLSAEEKTDMYNLLGATAGFGFIAILFIAVGVWIWMLGYPTGAVPIVLGLVALAFGVDWYKEFRRTYEVHVFRRNKRVPK